MMLVQFKLSKVKRKLINVLQEDKDSLSSSSPGYYFSCVIFNAKCNSRFSYKCSWSYNRYYYRSFFFYNSLQNLIHYWLSIDVMSEPVYETYKLTKFYNNNFGYCNLIKLILFFAFVLENILDVYSYWFIDTSTYYCPRNIEVTSRP